MLIYCCCRLRAAVAIRTVKVDGVDAMVTRGARECRAATCRFRDLWHFSIVVLPTFRPLGQGMVDLGLPVLQRVTTFEQPTRERSHSMFSKECRRSYSVQVVCFSCGAEVAPSPLRRAPFAEAHPILAKGQLLPKW